MKILIVDDSRAMRMIVKRTLHRTSLGRCDVVEAANGAEAITQLDAEHPDIVLCDWNMPRMTGIELLRALRHSGSQVTFGFITSESSDEVRAEAIDSGAQFIISKPFTAESLNAALKPCVT